MVGSHANQNEQIGYGAMIDKWLVCFRSKLTPHLAAMSETMSNNTLVELVALICVIREKTIHFWPHLFLDPMAQPVRQTDSTNTLKQTTWEFHK